MGLSRRCGFTVAAAQPTAPRAGFYITEDVRNVYHLSPSPRDQTCPFIPKQRSRRCGTAPCSGGADSTSGSALRTPSGSPPCPHLTPLPFQGPLSVPRAAASAVLTGVSQQQPLLSAPKVHLWVVLWEPRHTEVPVCSAPGLCSPPAKGEWAADAEHSRSSTAEPLAALC